MSENDQNSTSETREKEYKLCAVLPRDLAAEFTSEARNRAMKDDGKVKGSIGRAVEQAIRAWLKDEDEEEEVEG